MNKERRRFFRIEDTVGIKIEVIPPQEVESKLEQFWDDRHQFSLRNEFNFELEQHQADLRHIKNSMPEVARYLEVLQKQLDLITTKVLNGEDEFVNEEKRVNLSAQGISFYCEEVMHIGEMVKTNLKLLPGNYKVVILSRVIQCDKNKGDQGEYKVALDFEHIHEADREIMVKHVHEKQLRALGAARFEEDHQPPS